MRLAIRQSRSRGVWAAILALLDSPEFAGVLPKEQLGKAISYRRNHVAALEVFLGDPAVPIDNNASERLMKYVALGRKNWLFIGSLRAGNETADLMTLVHSALRNDLDPRAYLEGVLTRLLEGETDYESLHPDRWRETHPEDVRPHREEERRDRADRKQRDRAQRRAARRSQK